MFERDGINNIHAVLRVPYTYLYPAFAQLMCAVQNELLVNTRQYQRYSKWRIAGNYIKQIIEINTLHKINFNCIMIG